MASQHIQMRNNLFKPLGKFFASELHAISESGNVSGLDEAMVASIVAALEARCAEHVAQFKPAGRRKRKNPDDPKGPKNAYIFYNMDESVRSDMEKKYPDASRTEITKHIGEAWRNLSADEKKPYLEKAAADKERYQSEMSASASASASSEEAVAAPVKKTKKAPAKKAGAKKAKKSAK